MEDCLAARKRVYVISDLLPEMELSNEYFLLEESCITMAILKRIALAKRSASDGSCLSLTLLIVEREY